MVFHQHLSRLSPAVHRLINVYRLDVSTIKGTGPKGTILKGDVLSYLQINPSKKTSNVHISNNTIPPISNPEKEHISSTMRRFISDPSEIMKKNKPHIYYETECTIDKLLALKSHLESNYIYPTSSRLI
jgi:pyruvate dehydrogenase E2 component (dihydrolipoamide acetyltransferase)